MQLVDGHLVFSASDLTGYLACPHLLGLELQATRGAVTRPERSDPDLDVLTRRGLEHETRYLELLRAQGKSILEVAADWAVLREEGAGALRAAHDRTIEAMRSGADVIYQAAFFDGQWTGFADFLLRRERPSALGVWSYEVADTKLARHVKPAALLQTCVYSEQLERVQELSPEFIHVVLGDRIMHSHRYEDFAAYYRAIKRRFELAVKSATGVKTYPDPVEHCEVCRWLDVCDLRRRNDDHLSLVAGLNREQTRKLVAVGVPTLAALGAFQGSHVGGIGDPTLLRLERQARLQLDKRTTGKMSWKILPPAGSEKGLARLPEPNPGDLFFDIEGDPFVDDLGIQYLFGIAWREGEGKTATEHFRPFWGHDRAGEKKAFEELIDFIQERRSRYPDLHVYHYADYENRALKTLMGIHSTREEEVDDLLRKGVLVDLYRVVQQGIAISTESYSIKKLEPLYMPGGRAAGIKDAGSSIVAYEEWLESGEQRILDDIEAYNREDCISTLRLRDWLEDRRLQGIAEHGQEAFRRPPPREVPAESTEESPDDVAALAAALTKDVPAERDDRNEEQQARWLLAQLLGWHRREAKSEWWAYFDRCEMTPAELFEDDHCISGLEYTGKVGDVARSVIHGYHFDPAQEHRIKEDQQPHDPSTKKSAGEVVFLDDVAGVIHLKRGNKSEAPHPQALIPPDPIRTVAMRQSLRLLAAWVVEHGIDAQGDARAARDLLLSRTPRLSAQSSGPLIAEGEAPLDAAKRLVTQLSEGYLGVQGPPGAGKTFTGARMAVELLKRPGNVVGIMANSHKVISNLLNEVCNVALDQGIEIRAVQRIDDAKDACIRSEVRIGRSPNEVEALLEQGAVNVVGGTAWLFARATMAHRLSVLFIDEAGQLALANAIAVGPSTRNIVLLGDPNQLAQPVRGSHPESSGRSALEHVLGDSATMPSDRGLFLEKTYRMHPDVTSYVSAAFYDGRLSSDAQCSLQVLGGEGVLAGTGLRFVPVEHSGNRISSDEEAGAVRQVFDLVLGRPWTDRNGNTRTIDLDDVLVVTAYNAQVELLSERLPKGARIGTVDKFQGQEAPVTIYSMATSSAEDMPRTMDFLYSRNRLNVAVSRAFGISILVCSPRLLEVICRTPDQMRLANSLVMFTELAGETHL